MSIINGDGKMNLKEKIRTIENFPVEGIHFRDITTLLKDETAFHLAVDQMAEAASQVASDVDVVLAIEARGFILGSALAYRMNKGFVPVRKSGKLPGDTVKKHYGLEYGQDALEIHNDALAPGAKVLVVDDLLATGGTARAVKEMVESLGATVSAYAFLIELDDLRGREQLGNTPIVRLMGFKEDEK